MHPRDHASKFRASVERSVIFSTHSVRPWDLPSTCVNFSCISGTFSQLSVRPWYLPSTSVNSPCICGTFRQLLSIFCVRGTSQNVPCSCWSFHQLQSTFCASTGLSVNLRELYVQPRNLPLTFCATAGPSVNFHQHLYVLGNFR